MEKKLTSTTAYLGETGNTPLGRVWVAVSDLGLAGVQIQGEPGTLEKALYRFGFEQVVFDQSRAGRAAQQVSEYLAGRRRSFDLPIDWERFPDFQRQALQATFAIPYGKTRTYGEIAVQIGKPRAARAVGRAQATNPMPLVIPCHRVVGSDGKLHGYGGAGGLDTKAWLLRLEGAR